jgi:hypothetical protein
MVQHFGPSNNAGNISHTNIHGLLAIGDTLFVGTFEHGLDVMRISTQKVVQHFNADTLHTTFKSNFVECFWRTKKGEILVGTARGLFAYDPPKSTFTQIKQVPHQEHCVLKGR